MAQAQQPAFRAFTVIKRGEGQDDFWLPIGAAFPHRNGDGYDIVLQALPLDGRVVLRPPKTEDDDQRASPRNERADRNTRSTQSGARRR